MIHTVFRPSANGLNGHIRITCIYTRYLKWGVNLLPIDIKEAACRGGGVVDTEGLN